MVSMYICTDKKCIKVRKVEEEKRKRGGMTQALNEVTQFLAQRRDARLLPHRAVTLHILTPKCHLHEKEIWPRENSLLFRDTLTSATSIEHARATLKQSKKNTSRPSQDEKESRREFRGAYSV